jgi:Ca2+-binding EF-hand superfamily protein
MKMSETGADFPEDFHHERPPNFILTEEDEYLLENYQKSDTVMKDNKIKETPSIQIDQNAKHYSVYHEYGAITDDINHPGVRLYRTPKARSAIEKNQTDAIVSDFSSDTLRWMKKRRDMATEKPLVISSHREKQLREMFNSLDYEKKGAIDLEELTQAVGYVQGKTKGSKGLEQFQNIQEVFQSMDDNGDGTVDFSEFLRAMTGTTQSTFDKASGYDVQRLFSHFIEYGELKQREISLKKMKDAFGIDGSSTAGNNDSSKKPLLEGGGTTANNTQSVTAGIQYFKVLFGATADASNPKANNMEASKRMARDQSIRRSMQLDHVLQQFIQENSKNDSKQAEYLELQEKLRAERREAIQHQTEIMIESGHLGANNSNKRKKPLTRASMSSLPRVIPTSTLTSNSTGSIRYSPHQVLQQNTMVPAIHDPNYDLLIKRTVKKEAQQILKEGSQRKLETDMQQEFSLQSLSQTQGSQKQQLELQQQDKEDTFSSTLLKLPKVEARSSFNSPSKKANMIRASFAF